MRKAGYPSEFLMQSQFQYIGFQINWNKQNTLMPFHYKTWIFPFCCWFKLDFSPNPPKFVPVLSSAMPLAQRMHFCLILIHLNEVEPVGSLWLVSFVWVTFDLRDFLDVGIWRQEMANSPILDRIRTFRLALQMFFAYGRIRFSHHVVVNNNKKRAAYKQGCIIGTPPWERVHFPAVHSRNDGSGMLLLRWATRPDDLLLRVNKPNRRLSPRPCAKSVPVVDHICFLPACKWSWNAANGARAAPAFYVIGLRGGRKKKMCLCSRSAINPGTY